MDISIAIIFFNRPKELKLVFAQVCKIKPNKLFLIQDGPRNEDDIRNINECRELVENINWECEVYKNYSETNLGCGKRPYTGISWAFNFTDSLIILEDDCYPSISFFSYCKELLEKYENDYRVGIISGTNSFDEYDFGGYDYGFVKSGNISGWATWKSRWEKYDFTASLINDVYYKKCLLNDISIKKRFAKKRIKLWEKINIEVTNNEKVSYWDYQWGLTRHLNSYFAIIPRINLIKNIGFNENATHESNLYMLPKKIRKLYKNEIHNLTIINHPSNVIVNRQYDSDYYEIIFPNFFQKMWNKIIKLFKIIYFKITNNY